MTVATLAPVLTIAYDLSVPGSWDMACRHARWWGRLYVELFALDNNHIIVTFTPAPDPRWREWEAVRLGWILEDLQSGTEAAA